LSNERSRKKYKNIRAVQTAANMVLEKAHNDLATIIKNCGSTDNSKSLGITLLRRKIITMGVNFQEHNLKKEIE
jgi:hypothetical protein